MAIAYGQTPVSRIPRALSRGSVKKSYQFVGVLSGDTATWFWIGDHDAFESKCDVSISSKHPPRTWCGH
jgi:hypothetical protein